MRRSLSALFGASIALASPEALASGSWCGQGYEPFLSVGVGASRVGYSGRASSGFSLGGEASGGVSRDCFWYGGYADFYRDLDTSQRRWGAGLEAGYLIFGLDAGYMGYLDQTDSAHGFRIRGLITIGVLGVFVGGGGLFRQGDDMGVFEAGALLKLPIIPVIFR